MITLSVNNETARIEAGTPLGQALAAWGYGEQKIAVAVNGEFVPRSEYSHRSLQNGDQLDIVQPVGGG